MTVRQCLDNGLAGGMLSRDEHEGMTRLYEGLLAHYGDPNRARAEMVNRLMAEHQHAQRRALLAEDVRQRVEGFLLDYRNARGEADPAKAAVYMIEHNGRVRMPEGMSSVVGRYRSIVGLLGAELEGLIFEFQRTWLTGGARSTARLENVVREASGIRTGDAAAAHLAQSWLSVAEKLRQRYNAAGGAIGELKGWFLPQVHDRLSLLKVPKEQWVKRTLDDVDRNRMLDGLTGKPIPDAELAEILGRTYEKITTNNWSDREATGSRAGFASIGKSRTEHRFLHFKDADTWMAYNRQFGGGADAFSAMMGHLKSMAEDIAAMEILGPNPPAMIEYMAQFVERQAALRRAGHQATFPTRAEYSGIQYEAQGVTPGWLGTRDPEAYAATQVRIMRDMWRLYSGQGERVESQGIADLFEGSRNLMTSAKLGSAILSTPSDIGYQQITRAFNGIPAMRALPVAIGEYAKGLAGGGRERQRFMNAAGVIAESSIVALRRDAAWSSTLHGPGWTRVAADRTIVLQGLEGVTQIGKDIFGRAWMYELGRFADLDKAGLPPAMQRAFDHYGLSAKDWDAIRGSMQGELFLRPADVAAAMEAQGRGGERIAERYLEMILQETHYSTPEPTLQIQARAYGNLRRGTWRDETYRTGGQFKMFALTVTMLHFQRMATEMIQSPGRGASYLAGMLLLAAVYGAVGLQLKRLAPGKDPRPMDVPWTSDGARFWAAALLQGGGLGIYGDFLAAEQNRMGGGLPGTLVGPVVGTVSRGLSLTAGNVGQAVRGEKTHIGREVVREIGGLTPVVGSMWYLRAAYEHQILERLQRLADPEASAAFQRRIQSERRDYRSDFWWRPGDTAPDRMPDFGAALGR